jgi:hypothetical protein
VLLAPLVIGRFELAPSLLALAAARLWFSGSVMLGGVTAAAGALVKIFPGLVAGPAFVWEWQTGRRTWLRTRGTAAFVAALGAGAACWWWLAGGRVTEALSYHAGRGLEIESLFGGLALLCGKIAGTAVPWAFDHNAYHVASVWSARLAPWTFPIQAVAILVVMVRFWRSRTSDGLRYSAAAILAFIVFGKVLSPQYLIWLFPLLAALPGPGASLARKLFLLCCLITAFVYPGPGFAMILDHRAGAILLLNLRNVLLIWLLVMLL